jgi:AbrB family looped-hinge helix DNA binding protein
MALPHGPHKIATNGQVLLPKEVLAEAGLRPGDGVYLLAQGGTILVIPVEIVSRWFERGRQADSDAPLEG